MKNLYLLITIVMVLLAATASSNTNIPPANKAAEIAYVKQLIDRNVDYPEMCAPFDCGIVKVEITINREQHINIVAINGHPDLCAHVKARLSRITVAYPRLIGRQFICTFDFRSN